MLSPFGKYEGTTAYYIATRDISYAFWMIKNVKNLERDYPTFHARLKTHADAHCEKIIIQVCDAVLEAITDVAIIDALVLAEDKNK